PVDRNSLQKCKDRASAGGFSGKLHRIQVSLEGGDRISFTLGEQASGHEVTTTTPQPDLPRPCSKPTDQGNSAPGQPHGGANGIPRCMVARLSHMTRSPARQSCVQTKRGCVMWASSRSSSARLSAALRPTIDCVICGLT